MSSGYSSRTGHDLRSAERITRILEATGRDAGPSYFFVGGRISDDQLASEGMKEDSVHMQGPAEMIRDDLAGALPDYMVPNRIVVLDRMPLTANGKLDVAALAAMPRAQTAQRPVVAPRTLVERRIAELWREQLRRDAVSVEDDFFESGGNSLIAVGLINKINRELACDLPLQAVFEARTIEKLALRVSGEPARASSRLVLLHAGGSGRPVFCWPGLGGYPMGLRALAGALDLDRPFYGIQAHGLNQGELPFSSITEMAAEDVRRIRRVQPSGPYALWGYSFGAGVAFEAARQLERAGQQVEHVILLAPGSPEVRTRDGTTRETAPSYRNEAYVTILYSVFARAITDRVFDDCLQVARDDDEFAAFIAGRFAGVDPELIKRIIRVVYATYQFRFAMTELSAARIAAPVTILRARGDERSRFERASGCSAEPPSIIELAADHYSLLSPPGLTELVATIRNRLDDTTREFKMPHVNIKYFSAPLSYQQQTDLVNGITAAVKTAFHCDEKVISIALEPVEQDAWNERVYVPEILNRKGLLRKVPNY
jgi:thioesterase domain-containing protein/phenylpyruvate tautomerase PptA (4-oxalocrotonate tautomerase family)/acyl carrier protein